ncbi:hypothetical protein ACT3TH_03895 [Psychrobacter sp. AOP22-C1-C5]|uniref:hypothetical protein n=1 Tax=Psychrobacter sp. AOP22-C1-C5 TaxID=3457716 RepID=UPI004036AC40
MTIKPLTLQRLPMICAAGLLTTALLLSGCSNSDNTETSSATEDTAAFVETSDNESTAQTPAIDTNNADAQTVVRPEDEAATASNNNSAAATEQPSLVTNQTQSGTPEDTIKQALDSLYYGDVKQAATYYQVDMANFEQELAKTQSAFQQTVDGVTITDTKYNEDQTRATIIGELMLKGQSDPAPLTYELQKIAGQWKILG